MGRFDKDNPYIVALDFDGTIKQGKRYDLDWESWEITPGFLDFVEWTRTQNIKLVLWTCRNMDDKRDFNPVYHFLQKMGLVDDITVHFKQGAPYEFRGEVHYFWGTGSLKPYSDFLVDDLAVGCPMLPIGTPDWGVIRNHIQSAIEAANCPCAERSVL